MPDRDSEKNACMNGWYVVELGEIYRAMKFHAILALQFFIVNLMKHPTYELLFFFNIGFSDKLSFLTRLNIRG